MVTLDKVVRRLENVHRYSHYVSAICPFHDDNRPSLLVFDDGWFRCLGCGRAGTLDDLWRGLSGWLTKPSTYREPASFTPLNMPSDMVELEMFVDNAHNTLDKNLSSLGWYLRMRGVEDRVETCRLGWSCGWYTIPIYEYPSNSHKLVGAVARAGSHIQEATGQRFSQPKGQKPLMYCPDRFIMDNDFLVIVFGMFDAISMSKMRVPSVTSTAGKDSFNPEWLDFWRKRILIIPDKGEEETAVKLSANFGWRSRVVRIDYPDGTKDTADCLQKGCQDVVLNAIRRYA